MEGEDRRGNERTIPDEGWLVEDMGVRYGPADWSTILQWYNERKFSINAMVWKPELAYWINLHHYIQKPVADAEAKALLPSKYEIPIYLGIFVWMFGIFGTIGNTWVGLAIMVLGIGMEIWGMNLVRKNVYHTGMGTFGDIITFIFMAFQVFFTVILVLLTLS